MDEANIKVLLIAGYGRSGSTLLDRLLGQLPGVVSIGEFFWIWRWGFKDNLLCGCGTPFSDCVFWHEVMTCAFGSDGVDVDRMITVQNTIEGKRYGLPLSSYRKRQQLREYSQALAKVYSAIKTVSGCNIIVDSSKAPSRGFLLRRMHEVELYVVHIVRDSRAVAYSWQRKQLRPEIYWKEDFMPRKAAYHSALVWNAANTLSHLLESGRTHYELVRYEDLVCDPRREIARLSRWLGKADVKLEFLDGLKADLRSSHTVAGNPMRFKHGVIEIRPDMEWRTKMAKADRALISLLTWPLLFRYGYWGGRSLNLS